MEGVPGTKYISYHKSDKRFSVQKSINGKVKSLGGYKTLIGALMIRDYCIANNWKPYPKHKPETEKYISYRKNLNVWEIIKNINGKNEYFGRYHTLKEAIKWRDYFIKNNWNLDLRLIGTPNKNIYYKLGKYRIIKKIDGVDYTFGSFNTLTEAEKRIEEIKLKGWENVIRDNERLIETTVKNIIKLPNGKYEIIKNINGVKHTFGVYNTYEKAEEEVKLLRKCNWDYEALCESIDESQNGIIFISDDKKLKTSFEKQPKRNDGWLFNKYVNNPQFKTNQNYKKLK